MNKTYRKVATIQAEQFDGSDEMVKKYNIEHAEAFFDIQTAIQHAVAPNYYLIKSLFMRWRNE